MAGVFVAAAELTAGDEVELFSDELLQALKKIAAPVINADSFDSFIFIEI
jgi:hypothetical protein